MRALVIVLDSVGCGNAPDAADYGDAGADTLGHLLDAFPGFCLPALWSLGLGHILGRGPASTHALHGRMREVSRGKDSTTGHWELAGAVVEEPFAVYETFLREILEPLEAAAGTGFLGNRAASGTAIIAELGDEHVRTGKPILYTSADSVLQIAAHEEVWPPERLYALCRAAREVADAHRIGRVIARPFLGASGSYTRTAGRHDFSMRPPRTVLNAIAEAGLPVVSIGKVSDLFAGSGITASHPTASNTEGMTAIEKVWEGTEDGLVFANLVDFDTLYGHRRAPEGYRDALLAFDEWLGGFLPRVRPEDLLIITADHGNDPTFRGTDHTREEVPLMLRCRGLAGDLGTRATFADVAATLAAVFHLPPWAAGTPLPLSRGGRMTL
jgi:phosphopentomutase